MAVWPAGLPQKINQSGFGETLPDNVIRQDMEVGPSKIRRRDVSAPVLIVGNITVDETEYGLLTTFYNTTVAGGALPFDWVHPITGASVEMLFTQPPRISARSGDHYTINLNLEIIN